MTLLMTNALTTGLLVFVGMLFVLGVYGLWQSVKK